MSTNTGYVHKRLFLRQWRRKYEYETGGRSSFGVKIWNEEKEGRRFLKHIRSCDQRLHQRDGQRQMTIGISGPRSGGSRATDGAPICAQVPLEVKGAFGIKSVAGPDRQNITGLLLALYLDSMTLLNCSATHRQSSQSRQYSTTPVSPQPSFVKRCDSRRRPDSHHRLGRMRKRGYYVARQDGRLGGDEGDARRTFGETM
ncbi:hypothetical protein R3P38DRAFT_3344389 [Favolaschia claudopus]|uniref:Uncharacterized protein n=1 Tax=Favolaschia claudopus TaxID=2862362 RepID=A0AAW0DNW2_9AGAR